jgi:hypothetical protein
MKKLVFAICFLYTINLFSQDVITLKDKTSIKSKILEVTETTLKYKKFDNQEGPIYTISKKEIFNVMYQNGDTESFSNTKFKETREKDPEKNQNQQTPNQTVIVKQNRGGFWKVMGVIFVIGIVITAIDSSNQ